MKNKIGWCNTTWNPVWGCLNNCEYCYARKIAKFRYGVITEKEYRYTHKYLINSHIEWKVLENRLKGFKPTFLHSHFNKKFPKKPQRIFVGSMSEIYYWEDKWLEKVLEKVKLYPQHTFQFLTKYPQVYLNYDFPKNCWLGTTVTTNIDAKYLSIFHNIGAVKGNIYYYSIEPFLDKIDSKLLEGIDWVIIGAETGNRKGKVIPSLEWVANIANYCSENNIPVYIKDSIKGFYPLGIKEFPNYKQTIKIL